MSRVYLSGPIEKVADNDDGSLYVEGVLSVPTPDNDPKAIAKFGKGETFTAKCMRDAIPDYMRWGAVREMHQKIAAGTAIKVEVGDDGVTRIAANIVDDGTVKKIKAGVLKGWSLGANVLQRNSADPSVIEKIELVEASVVDRPQHPESPITLWKAADMATDKIEKGAEVYDARMALDMLQQAQSLLSYEKSEEHPEPPEQIAALQVIVAKLKEFIASEIMEGNEPEPAKPEPASAPATESTEAKADEPEPQAEENPEAPESEKAATIDGLTKQLDDARAAIEKVAAAVASLAPEAVAKAASIDTIEKRASVAEAGLVEAGVALRKVMAERDEYAALLRRKGVLRVVEKSADTGGTEKAAEVDEPKTVTESIRRIHASGGRQLIK